MSVIHCDLCHKDYDRTAASEINPVGRSIKAPFMSPLDGWTLVPKEPFLFRYKALCVGCIYKLFRINSLLLSDHEKGSNNVDDYTYNEVCFSTPNLLNHLTYLQEKIEKIQVILNNRSVI